jgi:hypothetical protein
LFSFSIVCDLRHSILAEYRSSNFVTHDLGRQRCRGLPRCYIPCWRRGGRFHSLKSWYLGGIGQPVWSPRVCNSPRTRRRGRIGWRAACRKVRGLTWIPVSESYRLCLVECP